MLEEHLLNELYTRKKKSMQEIADILKCSLHKISYWMNKYKIPIRSRSDAAYIKHNPHGDPFVFMKPETKEDFELWGVGIGLYWGEGNKANKNTVKIGSVDPMIINIFIKFLKRFFKINKRKLKFHLHIFSDIDINKAENFWIRVLDIKKSQLYKPTITRTGALGTYRHKSKFGVATLYYGNTKVRNIIVDSCRDSSVGRACAW